MADGGSGARSRLPLAALAVVLLGVAARLVPTWWSPLPATLDGFGHAALAGRIVAGGYPPAARADQFVFAGDLAAFALVAGGDPLTLAQPLVALVGGVSALAGLVFVHRVVGARWTAGRVRSAATVAGLGLALEGLYLRRSGVPDEEAVALLLVPLVALAVHRLLTSRRPAWAVVASVLLAGLPPLHTFGSLVAGLTVTAVVAGAAVTDPRRGTLGLGALVAGGFWAYVAGYYVLASSLGLTVPYAGRVTARPGLFLAWVVLLVAAVAWLRASPRAGRLAFVGPLVVGFLVVVVNGIVPVFPGTVPSPGPVVALIAVLLLPGLFAGWGIPLAADRRGVVVLASLLAPVALVFFALTAALTPAYFGMTMRAQTFVHPAAWALAGLVATRVAFPRARGIDIRLPRLRRVVVVVLLATAVVSAPLAFVDLDTGHVPSTTTQSEYAAVSFATSGEGWTSGYPLVRAATLSLDANASVDGAASWLRGGACPDRPMVSARYWTTTGAHLFPTAPATVSEERYERMLRSRDLVYVADGTERLELTLPTGGC
jgi:hypothetical protein